MKRCGRCTARTRKSASHDSRLIASLRVSLLCAISLLPLDGLAVSQTLAEFTLRVVRAYYDVAATFTGKFFAGDAPGHLRLTGYGHMGCCHLFIIEQIFDVAAQRAPVPPDDQLFSCTTTEWQSEYPVSKISSVDERVENNQQFLMDQARSHGDEFLAEKMKGSFAWLFVGLTGTLVWPSPDLLTTYTATFPRPYLPLQKNRHKQHEPPSPRPPLISVSRERCAAVSN